MGRGLSAPALEAAFPFHFRLDRELRVVEISPRLRKLIAGVEVGHRLEEDWILQRPHFETAQFEGLLDFRQSTFSLASRHRPDLEFRGQFVFCGPDAQHPEEAVFLGRPSATELKRLLGLGVTLADFAPHDAQADLLLALRRQEVLYEELERRHMDLELETRSSRFARMLHSPPSLEALFLRIAEGIADLLSLEDIVIYRHQNQLLTQVAVAGTDSPALQILAQPLTLPLGKGVVGTAGLERRTICLDDIAEFPGYVGDSFAGRSELCVPVILDGQLLGVFDSESKEVGRYSDADRAALEEFAAIAAPMIAAEIRRRRAEEVILRENQRLKHRNLAFQASSHEFRTPLAQISSTLELIRRHGERLEAAEVSELLSDLASPLSRLERLFHSMLSLQRQESGTLEEAEVESFCLNEQIKRVAADCLRPYGREFDLSLGLPDQQVIVESDPEWVAQIVVNLLTNAAKYSRVETPIRLELSLLGSGQVALEVSDRGIGMTQDELSSIFEPHVRHDAAIAMAEGTGIGLSIVRDRVNDLGGHVTVRSAPGQGTTFRVTLPLNRADGNAA